MNIHALRITAIVIALDVATKITITTPDWGRHHRDGTWLLSACFFIYALLAAMTTRFWPGASIVLGGVLGNVLDVLVSGNAGAHNPFVRGVLAYNLADVAILVGGGVLLLQLMIFTGSYFLRQREAG